MRALVVLVLTPLISLGHSRQNHGNIKQHYGHKRGSHGNDLCIKLLGCALTECPTGYACKEVPQKCGSCKGPCYPLVKCEKLKLCTPCPANEERQRCFRSCDEKCDFITGQQHCQAEKRCGRNVCRCKSGFGRNQNGVCVARTECPVQNVTVTTTTPETTDDGELVVETYTEIVTRGDDRHTPKPHRRTTTAGSDSNSEEWITEKVISEVNEVSVDEHPV